MSFPNRFTNVCLFLFLTAVLTRSALAQYHHPPEPAPAGAPTLNADLVKTGLYIFSGGGGNSLLRLSANGFILVNAGLPSERDVLLRKVKRISNQPIRALILTDNNLSHAGAVEKFVESGTRIVAQRNAAAKLATLTIPELTAPRLITYDHDYALRLGGVEVQLLHFGNAHTDGDTVVYFPNLKVVAAGALIGVDANPDFSSGGSLLGWHAALTQMLKLDFDVAVPGKGPVQERADVEALKAQLDSLVTRASRLTTKGMTKDQFLSELRKGDSGLRLSESQLISFYNELASTERDRSTTRPSVASY